MSLAFLGILFVIICLYTKIRAMSISQKTIKIPSPLKQIQALAALPDKVTAIGFFTTNTPTDTAQKLLTNYKSNSKASSIIGL